MTAPKFQTLPLGNPDPPTDRLNNEIKHGSPIAYAVSDGYLSVGRVEDIIYKVKDEYNWQTKQTVPTWTTRLKVEVARDRRYSGGARYVNLTKMGNIVVLDGPSGQELIGEIQASWVDTEA